MEDVTGVEEVTGMEEVTGVRDVPDADTVLGEWLLIYATILAVM